MIVLKSPQSTTNYMKNHRNKIMFDSFSTLTEDDEVQEIEKSTCAKLLKERQKRYKIVRDYVGNLILEFSSNYAGRC